MTMSGSLEYQQSEVDKYSFSYYNKDGSPKTIHSMEENMRKIYNLSKNLETRIYSHPKEVKEILMWINQIAGE